MNSRRRRLRTMACSCAEDFYDDFNFLEEQNNSCLIYDLSELQRLNHSLLRSYVHNEDIRNYFIVDATNKIIEVSNAWCKTCGYTHKEAYNMSFAQLQGPETCHKSIDNFMKSLNTNNHAKMDIINYNNENKRLDLHVSAVVLYNFDDVYPYETPKYLCEAIIKSG